MDDSLIKTTIDKDGRIIPATTAKCKRDGCDAPGISIAKYYGYCSLQCRDTNEQDAEIGELKARVLRLESALKIIIKIHKMENAGTYSSTNSINIAEQALKGMDNA